VNSRVSQSAGDDLDAAVVTIEPHLAQENAGSVGEVGAAVAFLEFGGGGVEGGGHAERW
jgi:hypothetical protein